MMSEFPITLRQGSPKSSPHGSRSPAYPRQDSSGTLKTTITLGKNPSVLHRGPFYLMKEPPEPGPSDLTGSVNLMSHYGLEHSYNKFCGKKLREELSAFLPSLPGNIDTPGHTDGSSLKMIVEKPPILGKELVPLSGALLSGFRLHPGPLPERYRMTNSLPVHKKKHKRKRYDSKENLSGATPNNFDPDLMNESNTEYKKTKKNRSKNDEERKRRKREKKRKREKEKEERGPMSS